MNPSDEQLTALAEAVGRLSDLGIQELLSIINDEIDVRLAQQYFRQHRN